MVLAFVPIGAAMYMSATRYSDFRHDGFDILASSLMGFVIGWLSFRWYHLPIRRGAGWSWGARTRDRAFAVPVGVHGYVGYEGWEHANAARPADLENGGVVNTSTATGAGPTQYYQAQPDGLQNRL